MFRRLPVWLALAAASIFGQEQTGTVDGHVMNSLTGEAIGGAIVHLIALRSTPANRAARELQATSLADGSFHFDGVAQGTYLIHAEHPGFNAPHRGNFVELTAGQSAGDEKISLAPDSTLSGTVVDDAGSPVPGARIAAIAQVTAIGQTVIEERSTADAGSTGSFTVKGLKPGNYFVVAEPPAPEEVQVPERQKQPVNPAGELVRTLFPRALSLEEATAIPITVGQSPTDVKVYLRRATTHHVRGKIAELIQDRASKIALRPRGAANSDVLGFQGVIEKNGAFDIGGVLPGEYTLQLFSHRPYRLARQNINVGAQDVNGVVLNLLSPVTLEGKVSVDSNIGTALPRVQIFVKHLDDRKTVTVNANADGAFFVNNLDPEPSLFRAQIAAHGFYVKSILLNGQDAKDHSIDLAEIGRGKLEVVLRAAAGEIDGSVTDAWSGATVGIVAVPQQIAPDAYNVVQKYSRNDGTFVISNLEPGEYRLYAIAAMEWALWQTPEFLQAVQSFGTSVEVEENQRQQVQLKEIPQETIQQAADQLGLTVE
jgi:Carboxypeptidase regulatory-like domain